jgi:hypothetical protein
LDVSCTRIKYILGYGHALRFKSSSIPNALDVLTIDFSLETETSETLKKQFQLLQEQQQKKLQRRKQKKEEKNKEKDTSIVNTSASLKSRFRVFNVTFNNISAIL